MKPRKLVLTNVGPFHGAPTTIDFSSLDRLFAITGATGAGKTTLFDAMCFALYGKPLGTRAAEHLRSQYATPSEPTKVLFEFEHEGKQYKIERSPAYDRAKLRGSGTTPQAASGQLHALDAEAGTWNPVTGEKGDPSGAVASLLRLSHEEFSKILVLPQGQFQQFLEMETKDRRAILERLFPIDDHTRVVQQAKERAQRFDEQLHDLQVRTDELRKSFDPSTYDADRARLEGVARGNRFQSGELRAEAERTAKALTDGEQLAIAADELEGARAELRRLDEGREAVDADRAELDGARRAERVRAELDQEARAQAQLIALGRRAGEIETARAALEPELLAARDELEQSASWEREAEQLAQTRRDDARELERVRQAVDVHARVETTRRELEGLEGARDAALARWKAQRDALGAFTGLEAERSALDQRAKHVTSAREPLLAVAGAAAYVAEYETTTSAKHSGELKAARDEHRRCTEALAQAQAELDGVEASLLADDATKLAARLEDGAPCPVCGSTEHPNPASAAADVARGPHGPRELAQARKARDAAAREEQTARTLVTTTEALARGAEERRDSELAQLARAGFAALDAYRRAWEAVEAERSSLDVDSTALAAQERERDLMAKQVATLLEEANVAEGRLGPLREAEAVLRGQLVGFPPALREKDGVERARERLVASVAAATEAEPKLRARIASARARHEELTRAQAESWALSRELEAETEKARRALAQAELDANARVASEGFATREQVREALRDAAAQRALEARLDAYDAQRSRLEATVRTREETLAGRTAPDLGALRGAREEARERFEATLRRAVELEGRRNDLEARKQADDALTREREKLGVEAAVVSQLSKMLVGANAAKLDFATFVLASYLDRVLERANVRLATFTDRRYALERDAVAQDRRSSAGLELVVTDVYAGGRRSVKTLSGGEKFLASLALALGLADVVQERAGGVAVDTLFIDEGFGSLDPDSLDRALAVLEELGAQRRVGVISHVDALKRAIPCQVVVHKGTAGSRVEIRGASPPTCR